MPCHYSKALVGLAVPAGDAGRLFAVSDWSQATDTIPTLLLLGSSYLGFFTMNPAHWLWFAPVSRYIWYIAVFSMYMWYMHPPSAKLGCDITSLMFRWYLLSTWIVSCTDKKTSKFWLLNIPTSHFDSLRPVADNWPSTRLSLVYHNVVPTVCAQLEGDRTKITKAVVVGSFIPFVMQHHSLLKNLVPFLKLMLRMWTIQ